MLPEGWKSRSSAERFALRFAAWKEGRGIPFASEEARRAYQERVQRFWDVVELRRPDRVPTSLVVGFYPAKYAGITTWEAMYDYDKLGMAWRKFNEDFPTDSLTSCLLIFPGRVAEILDVRYYRWPGHGVPEDVSYQYMEGEYMREEEYDWFIEDPTDFLLRAWLPRVVGALEGLRQLLPVTPWLEYPVAGPYLLRLSAPEVQRALESLLEAGRATLEWAQKAAAIDQESTAQLGLPSLWGGFTKAPFDALADTLRGTRGIMLDIYRRPDRLLRALERMTPLMIRMGVEGASFGSSPFIFIPLHKGADGFMSRETFARFYWPFLKAVILGLIEEGFVPWLFVEGSYNERVDFLGDPELPRGRTFWHFDQTDMRRVKEVLGGKAAFGGNVPASLLHVGTPEEVRRYVRDLIEAVAQDGGFVLLNGAVLEDARAENVRAMVEAGVEYGRYR
ncbi:MAG: uroporphyrinogen decarboxylase family protein [Armatimonadota bacterium]|nr:uroporphyrinogen decarboxylase family protein [Armatimonadota bacterium]MDR7438915.1 uroporphyrinogen decarboxylase family protein [Armatimonadota bacterium]MDR7562455.1 uroporphyrinogen decarboxylase family protein [Armatimonadota bacterium]MDR7567043.1 uroporphyrinogen decarboxylase family protein [Armatimonadota bacterium]MDR7601168.1 uroporphyrinogen decarboxylase family protein [Armatimonadota bacterium]